LSTVADANGPIMANRVLGAIRAVVNWALHADILEASPVAGLKRPGEEHRGARALTDAEILEVWNAAGTIGYPFGHIVRALLVTGQRRGEVAGLPQSEIERQPDGPVWTIPGERTKNKLPHEVPLTPLAVELIEVADKEREAAQQAAAAGQAAWD
jgi:integrase